MSILLSCPHCSRDFQVKPSRIARAIVLPPCCSISCSRKYRDERGIGRRKTPELKDRFHVSVNKTESCWIWTGTINKNTGYGIVTWGTNHMSAHRASWILQNGEIPEGLCVLHNCPTGDNRACVNPDHLFLGTKGDNNRDRKLKGRSATGDLSGRRLHPDRYPRGDQHFSHLNPEKLARGVKNGSRLHPEKRPRGERHGMAKINREIVLAIRSEYDPPRVNQTTLSEKFSISRTNVRDILNFRTWKHVA